MPGRKLTPNEISFAKQVFSDSIKYGQAMIYDEKFAFFQPDNSGMTPNGNIYVSGGTSSDYGSSIEKPPLKAFFIHELTHVWKKQNNVLNPIISAVANSMRHGFFYEESYKYLLEKDKDFLEYRIEQQAQIIEDYTRITILNINPNVKHIKNRGTKADIVALFHKVLSNFISNPSYPSKGR